MWYFFVARILKYFSWVTVYTLDKIVFSLVCLFLMQNNSHERDYFEVLIAGFHRFFIYGELLSVLVPFAIVSIFVLLFLCFMFFFLFSCFFSFERLFYCFKSNGLHLSVQCMRIFLDNVFIRNINTRREGWIGASLGSQRSSKGKGSCLF